MTDTVMPAPMMAQRTKHFDVLIVGAGISGIGGAYHLTQAMSRDELRRARTQETFGGTWLTHRYPGIRSDSDLYTFGYRFKPWTGAPIATAAEILRYMGEVIDENDLARHIRYRHRIASATLVEHDNLWTIDAARTDTGEHCPVHRELPVDVPGLLPPFGGLHAGVGRHGPVQGQHRPSAEMAGGSGLHGQARGRDRLGRDGGDADPGDRDGLRARHDAAALADLFPHRPQRDRDRRRIARAAGRRGVDPRDRAPQDPLRAGRLHPPLVRRAGEGEAGAAWPACAPISAPTTTSRRISRRVTGHGGNASPSCRMAICSQAIRAGKASVVTDEIERFTETGILLKSGKMLEADIIVTATGFHLNVLGDIDFTIDGEPLMFSDTVTYRGMMFTGVPNMAWVFGYFRASWTLRADLVADFVCRLLNHMKATGARRVTVALRPEDQDMPLLPWIDPENFNPGYLMRGMHLLPKRGDKPEWQHTQDYWTEKDAVSGDRPDRPRIRLRLTRPACVMPGASRPCRPASAPNDISRLIFASSVIIAMDQTGPDRIPLKVVSSVLRRRGWALPRTSPH